MMKRRRGSHLFIYNCHESTLRWRIFESVVWIIKSSDNSGPAEPDRIFACTKEFPLRLNVGVNSKEKKADATKIFVKISV
jgi:hypothetical protein